MKCQNKSDKHNNLIKKSKKIANENIILLKKNVYVHSSKKISHKF